jgi:hypothetical protein
MHKDLQIELVASNDLYYVNAHDAAFIICGF